MVQEKTERFGMSCPASILKVAKFIASNNQALRSWSTTFCGVLRASYPHVARSVSSTALTTRKFWSSGVHPEILRNEGLSAELRDEKNVWKERYRSIENFETHLHANGTHVVKIFLHLSKEEQRKRFLDRIDEPDKNWKFSLTDVQERKYWTQYGEAFEECVSATSTDASPWYVVPADDKENARLIVSRIVMDALIALKMSYPKTTDKRKAELQTIRKLLEKQAAGKPGSSDKKRVIQ
jgi:hypothetical protein